MRNNRVRWMLLVLFVWKAPQSFASKTTQLRPSRTFLRTAEYISFTQQVAQTEQPWQQEKQRCGWDLHVHFHRKGQASFRYGPFYRGFILPSSTQNTTVRARTLLLLLGLFWDAVQQEMEAGALSCKQRKTRILQVALPGTLQAPLIRPKPKRRIASRPRTLPAPITPQPNPMRPRPLPPKAPPKVPKAPPKVPKAPPKAPKAPPKAPKAPPKAPKAPKRVALAPPKLIKKIPPPIPFDFSLGAHFSPFIGFNGNLIWGGSITTLYWSRSPWRMRIEATGARFNSSLNSGQIIAQLNTLAEWVPWRTKFFSWDIHLGLSLIFSWSFNEAGSYLWMTPGLQGGTTFSWTPTERLTFFLRLDIAYFPFLSPAKDDTSYIHLHDAYAVPIIGASWRF